MQALPDTKGKLVALRCDLSKEQEVLQMFQTIKDKFGGVDVCVNCAGLSHKNARLVDGQTDKWKDILDVS